MLANWKKRGFPLNRRQAVFAMLLCLVLAVNAVPEMCIRDSGEAAAPLPGRFIASAVLDALWARCEALLTDYHAKNPLHAGIRAAELRQRPVSYTHLLSKPTSSVMFSKSLPVSIRARISSRAAQSRRRFVSVSGPPA